MPTSAPSILSGILHFELFTSKRSGDLIRVRCWCDIGKEHTYADWIDAGRPSVFGKVLPSATR